MSISAEGEGQVRVRGRGIQEAIAGRKATFVLETGAETLEKEFECQITGEIRKN